MKQLRSQVQVELGLVVRHGEQLLLTLGIPVMLLVFFSLVDVLPTDGLEAVEFLIPGILALAVMSTAMVSLGISTGFERSYHVLKRLATTPLGRPRLIAAKTITVALVEVLQAAILVGVAIALGWSPDATDVPRALGAVVLGTLAFAGVGLLLAGRLRGEINLAVQNGLYLVLLLGGGLVISAEEFPGALRTGARYLPSGALADALRDGFGVPVSHTVTSWLVLLGWAIGAPVVAAITFRWD